MGDFNVSIKGGDALVRKLQKATETIQIETVKIINESVKEISVAAKARVPVKTGYLKGTIGYTKYQEGEGATVYADAHYAPYVEFGTGDFGFGIPVYPNVDMGELEAYALTFKRNKKTIGMPYRPFMFNSYSEVLSKMVNKIKKIRI
jgi:HK97 gp10 family phage protein